MALKGSINHKGEQNKMINFSVEQKEGFSVVSFEIEGGVMSPSELAELQPPTIPGNQGVILSGRGPVYLFAFLVHHYHPTQWVACFAPAEGGGVVVESHVKGIAPGQIIPLEGK